MELSPGYAVLGMVLDTFWSIRTWFLTRLPATYNECSRVIRDAVFSDEWIEVGPLAEERDRPKRPIARYRAWDGTVALYGKTYRAIGSTFQCP